MLQSSTLLRHFVVPFCIASAILSPLNGTAAAAERVSANRRPAQSPMVLEKNLRAMPENDRTRHASRALASSLEGVDKNSDQVLHLFEASVAAAPKAVLALMEVAHRAAPGRIVEITEIALEQTTRKSPRRKRDFKDIVPPGERDFKGGRDGADDHQGREDQVASILNKAIALAPDQRGALTSLVAGMFSPAFSERVFASIGGVVLGSGGLGGTAALSGTINPANIGGSVIVREGNEADPEVVSPEQ